MALSCVMVWPGLLSLSFRFPGDIMIDYTYVEVHLSSDAGTEDFPQAVPRPQGQGDQARGAWPCSTGAINLVPRTQTTLMSLGARLGAGAGAHLGKGALE